MDLSKIEICKTHNLPLINYCEKGCVENEYYYCPGCIEEEDCRHDHKPLNRGIKAQQIF